jgi:putative nucleotidyltransferase with HDIG domain
MQEEQRRKKVLLVDDDPMVLANLKRTLELQKSHWDMGFAAGAEAALALLEVATFDVVVSDLRMPRMDGAALLKALCEKFPNVVRIVLADPAEMEEALRAVPVAHQFLTKPCDVATLRVAVERATSLSNILSNKLLAGMVGSVQDLPLLPRTYMELSRALADPGISFRKIVKIVEQDVAISAKILQLVNSAFFGLPREITTLHTAISFLGTQMVQNLVLSAEVFHVFDKAASFGDFSFEELHTHSQLVAKIAGRIPAPAHVRSAAVIAALLHDVGKLVLATRSPKHFARALEGVQTEKLPLYAVEENLIGVSHAEVGAYLLGLWGLPSPIVEAVAHHHHPASIPHDSLDAVGIVHIANSLAHEHPVYPPSGEPAPYQFIAEEYVEMVGLGENIAEWEELAEAVADELRSAASSVS